MTAGGHLDHYLRHHILPVRYQAADLPAHFQRRESLYRMLGLPPAVLRGCDVLEVAPGTGQNALFVAHAGPANLDLVEPNPIAVEEIRALFAEHADRIAPFAVHESRFEDFSPGRLYDVVICENWLGSLPHERALIGKLADLVRPGGLLILTVVPFTGFLANVLRRLLALRLTDPAESFDVSTARMADVFGAHLSTIAGMTRSHADWVQDCVLNPHYLHVVLPLDQVLTEIGDRMDVLGSAPRFAIDWRWFKGLHGDSRRFNAVFAESYQQNVHNLIDCRRTFPARAMERNARLEALARSLHEAALVFQQQVVAGVSGADADLEPITDILSGLEAEATALDDDLGAAMADARSVWSAAPLTPEAVRDMSRFGALFGRETVYLSLTRTTDWGSVVADRERGSP